MSDWADDGACVQHTCVQRKYDCELYSGQAETVLCWCFVALSRDLVTGPTLVLHVKLKHVSILKLNLSIELLAVVLMDKMA